jgi:hypothetical protein
VVVESNLPREDLERYGLIVLANVARPPEEFVARLAAYVRHGGALAIFPGDLVDPNVYERLFGTGGATGEPGPNLLPARLDELLGSPERPLHPIPDYQHPAFALLAGAGEGLFRLVDVVRFRALEPVPSARVGARLGDNPGSPLLVEREVGAGRVALFAVPADAEWTSWPQNPSYLPAMLELASSLARRQGATSNGIAGAPIFVAIDLARHQREALLRTPSYPRSAERRLIAAPEAPAPEEPAPAAAAEAEPRTDQDTNVNAGTDTDTDTDTGTGTGTGTGFRFTVSDTRESGVYELAMRSVAGATEVRHLAVNAAVEESDLTRIAPEEIERLYPGVRVVRDLDTAETSERARFEVADGLLAAFLVLLLLESLLALRVARHARNVSDARAGAGLVGGTAVRDREYTGGPRR